MHNCDNYVVGVQQRGVYDGVLYFQCSVCQRRWHRFPEGDYLRTKAEPYVTGAKP
jgi:formate dehydrogenase maturation protein FdhE